MEMDAVSIATLPKMIEAFLLLQRMTNDPELSAALKKHSSWVPSGPFQGTNADFEFLIKCLNEGSQMKEGWDKLKEEVEVERCSHLETIRQYSLICPDVPKALLDEKLRIQQENAKGLIQHFKNENDEMKNQLRENLKKLHGFQLELEVAEKALSEKEDEVRQIEADHAEILLAYQTEMDKITYEMQGIEGKSKEMDELADSLAPENVLNYYQIRHQEDQDRLQQLWEENNALGDQLNTLRSQMGSKAAPKGVEEEAFDVNIQHEKEMERILKMHEDLSDRVVHLDGELAEKKKQIKNLEAAKESLTKELESARALIAQLKAPKGKEDDEKTVEDSLSKMTLKTENEDSDGWKVLDVETDSGEEGKTSPI